MAKKPPAAPAPSAPSAAKPPSPKKPDSPLKKLAKHRGRPCAVLRCRQPIDRFHLFRMEQALDEKDYDELDVVLHSAGGDPHAAYQIVRLIRFHAKKVNMCVPVVAASAATLICLGGDRIVLAETAQLGPLDSQVAEERSVGRRQFTSALNPFKMLEQLQKFSNETFDLAFKLIEGRTDLDHSACCQHAIEFVKATAGQMYAKLDPEKFGEYSRALLVGTEYGHRLLKLVKKWDDKKRADVLDQLVHGYPSHDFIINYHELQEMGFDVDLMDLTTRKAMEAVIFDPTGDGELVQCAEP